MIRILFLAASPIDLQHLRIRQERNAIQRALDSAPYGKHFALIEAFDVNVDELQELLFRHQPHIVHFSGHGEAGGELYLKDDDGLRQPVTPHALGNLFAQFKHTVRLVVLNSCSSTAQASAIASAIDFVVGMTEAITDTAALSFAEAFYRATANGATLATMFELACNQLDLKNLAEAHKPHLYQRNDPQQLRFIDLAASTTNTQTPASIPKLESSGDSVIAGNVQTGRDFIGHDQIIINLVQGMADLPTHYDGPVRNFLSYYLGSAVAPAPFGGRDDDLARLDQWLAGPETARYLLLAAPAGRGKSALLAHWIAALMQRDAVHVVFFPISIRFSTNRENVVFAALAARLARIYGEKLTPAIDAQQYRGVVSDYLQRTPPDGKPLLIVIDGLDEAAGWEAGADLFPLQPPAQLRVVVAARLRANDATGAGWLTQLGWEAGLGSQFMLPTLDRDSVADVLAKMGNPLDVLATKIDVVTKLHELSEGDPLLVRLYVEALLPQGAQMATFAPEDLLSLKPGLKAFFDRWFEEQKKLWSAAGLTTAVRDSAVNGLLNLCALAKGPLSRDDLFALAAKELPNGATIDWAAETLNRFIIGDGSVENGYTFGHPRFGYYFAERLPTQERKGWHDRFLAYGRQLLTDLENKIVEPKDASPYAVRYYGAHLAESKASPSEFYALVCEGWLRTWEWIDGTPDGFLNNVYYAWNAAEKEGVTALGQMVRAVLCFSSVVSQNANIPADLLVNCVRSGVTSYQLAQVMARTKPDIDERLQALIKLSELAAPEQKLALLMEVLSAVRSLEDDVRQVQVLFTLAEHIRYTQNTEILSEAIIAARNIKNNVSRVMVLCILAQQLSSVERTEILVEIVSTVHSLENEKTLVNVLRTVARYLPEEITLLLSEVFATEYSVQSEEKRMDALQIVAKPSTPEAIELAAELVTLARNIEDYINRVRALCAIAEYLPEIQRQEVINEVLKIAHSIENEESRSTALELVARYLPATQKRELLEMAQMHSVLGKWKLANTLAEKAMRLSSAVQMQMFNEVLTAIRSIGDRESRMYALVAVVDRLPPVQQIDVLNEAQSTACDIEDHWSRAYALAAVAKHLQSDAQIEILCEALAAVRSIDEDDEEMKVYALATVVENLPPTATKLVAEALEIVQSIKDEWLRGSSLAIIVSHLSTESTELLNKTQVLAQSIESDLNRLPILLALANNLPLSQQTQVHADAVAIAHNIGTEWSRIDAIIALTANLSTIQQKGILAEALLSSSSEKSTLVEVLTGAHRMPTERDDEWTPAIISSSLPLEQQISVLDEALSAARNIADSISRKHSLTIAASPLPNPAQRELLIEALTSARSIGDELARISTIVTVVAYLPLPEWVETLCSVLTEISNIKDEENRTKLLTTLAAHLPPKTIELSNKILIMARNLENEWNRANVLLSIIPNLSPDAPEVFYEVLSIVHTIKTERRRIKVLIAIAEQLSLKANDLVTEVLTISNGLKDEESRLQVLAAAATCLPLTQQEKVLTEAINVVRGIVDAEKRVYALVAIGLHLTSNQKIAVLTEALRNIYDIKNEKQRARVLATVVTNLPSEPTSLLAESLTLAYGIGNEESRADIVITVVERLPSNEIELLTDALSAAQKIKGKEKRVQVMTLVAIRLPLMQQKEVIAEVIAIARNIIDMKTRVSMLAAISLHVKPEQQIDLLTEAFTSARSIEGQEMRAYALAAMIEYIPPEATDLLMEVLSTARNIQNEWICADLLVLVSKQFPLEKPLLFFDALAIACNIKSDENRSKVLVALATRLSLESTRIKQSSPFALEITKKLLRALIESRRSNLLNVIIALVPIIARLGGERAIRETTQAIHDTARWWP